jgi:hypothetical protein
MMNGLIQNYVANKPEPVTGGQLTINSGGAVAEFTAGWAVAEVAIWNRQLNFTEMGQVWQYFKSTYSLSFSPPCATFSPQHLFVPSPTPGSTDATATPIEDRGAATPWSFTPFGGVKYDDAGTALVFDGAVGSYVSLGAVTLPASDVSVAAWVRWDDFTINSYPWSITNGSYTQNAKTYMFNMGAGTDKKIYANVVMPGVWRTVGPATYWPRSGEWNFVLVTLSAQGALEMYVNGVTQDVSALSEPHAAQPAGRR